MYYKRNIDNHLLEWSKRDVHKPLLLRGARQVASQQLFVILDSSLSLMLRLTLNAILNTRLYSKATSM